MKYTDKVVHDANEKRREDTKRRAPYFNDDLNGTEMGYAYEKPIPYINLNSDVSIFDKKDETSINTSKSIFDKTAVFHVNRPE